MKLIKDVVRKDDAKLGVRKGDPILFTPSEAFTMAVEKGVRSMRSEGKIFWVRKESVKPHGELHHSISQAVAKKREKYKNWKAVGKGTAMIGYTDIATDRFYEATPYNFEIEFETGKDGLGLPDLVVTKFSPTAVSTNPTDRMKPVLSAAVSRPSAQAAEVAAPKLNASVRKVRPQSEASND